MYTPYARWQMQMKNGPSFVKFLTLLALLFIFLKLLTFPGNFFLQFLVLGYSELFVLLYFFLVSYTIYYYFLLIFYYCCLSFFCLHILPLSVLCNSVFLIGTIYSICLN